jgi:hypothetical protein
VSSTAWPRNIRDALRCRREEHRVVSQAAVDGRGVVAVRFDDERVIAPEAVDQDADDIGIGCRRDHAVHVRNEVRAADGDRDLIVTVGSRHLKNASNTRRSRRWHLRFDATWGPPWKKRGASIGGKW